MTILPDHYYSISIIILISAFILLLLAIYYDQHDFLAIPLMTVVGALLFIIIGFITDISFTTPSARYKICVDELTNGKYHIIGEK